MKQVNFQTKMTKNEICNILKIATGFELDEDNFATGSISKSFKSKYENFPHNDIMQEYINEHYPKMKKMLESLPWEKEIMNPRNPQPNDYPTEEGLYITMMDCNEHEVCTNEFHDGRFAWMNNTHIKWWMKLPE